MKQVLWCLATLWLWTPCLGEEPTEPAETPYRFEDHFTFGAWADMLYMDSDADDEQEFFDVAHLYVFGKYTFGKRWSSFAEVAFEQEPNLQGEADDELSLERLYLQYDWREWVNLRLGKFDTRAGIIKPIHWAITLDSIRRPIMEDNSYVPAKSVGLEVFGKRYFGEREFNYSFALSHSENEVTDDHPIDRAKSVGLDLQWQRFDRYRYGFSYILYRDPKDKDRSVEAWLPYAEVWFWDRALLFRVEVLNLTRNKAPDLLAWYAKAKWQISREWTLNFRHDQGEDELSAQGRERHSQSLTLAFFPSRQWRFRVELSQNHIESDPRQNFTQWLGWAGWIF
ncbi:hypothetical protein [Sulfidibacter corallicola]|uniref:Uncharacterized protein n=1 Tax=Sulfidibacter corallicola TaxID=2818388 RepID=A0A8A4TNJ2_SULCO|nr:hypothetical protein [Sulfidibacter corallicola]QTD50997.1 hypothetical protein J3U87_00880 [Sulfidibacter corallicola]